MSTKKPTSDFDPDALAQTTDEHSKALGSLQDRVGTNENFGKTFAKAARDSVSLRSTIGDIVTDMIKKDTKTQGAIEKVVNGIDGRQFKGQLFVIGKILLWLLSLAVTAAVTTWINHKVR